MQRLFTRDFLFITIGQTISMFGTAILKFTISLYILDLTGSAAVFGTMTAVSCIPQIFLSPLGGVLADRLNKRGMMVALDCAYGLISVVLGSVLTIGHTVMLLGIVLVLLSVVSSFEAPVVQSSIPLIQPKEQLIKANAVVNQVGTLANLVGPLLAGLLYGIVGFVNVKVIIYGSSVCFFLAAALESFIQIPYQKPDRADNAVKMVIGDFLDGLRFVVRERPYIFKAIVFNAVFLFLIQPLLTVGAPYIIKEALGLSSFLNGISQAAMGVAGLLGGFITGMIAKRFRVRWIWALFSAMGVVLLPLGIVFLFGCPPIVIYFVLAAGSAAICLTAGIVGINQVSATQKKVPGNMLGRAMSFYATIPNCAMPVGMILYGTMYERWAGAIHLIIFITVALIVLMGLLSRKTYHELDE